MAAVVRASLRSFPLATGVGAVSTRQGSVDVFVLDEDGGALSNSLSQPLAANFFGEVA